MEHPVSLQATSARSERQSSGTESIRPSTNLGASAPEPTSEAAGRIESEDESQD